MALIFQNGGSRSPDCRPSRARIFILGHTNASFTLDTYTHVTGDMQKQATEVVGSFLEDILGKELKPWQDDANTAPVLSD